MLRVFSNNKDLSFNNYLRNKSSETVLVNLKSKNKNYYNNNVTIKDSKIINYLNYNDFLNLTQTFYKLSNYKSTYKSPIKIIDLKTSFLFYNKFLNHIQVCDFCKTNNIQNIFTNCKEIKNILYPYGEYSSYEINSKLSTVDLNNWCHKCFDFNNDKNTINEDFFNNNNNNNNNCLDNNGNKEYNNNNNNNNCLDNNGNKEYNNNNNCLDNKEYKNYIDTSSNKLIQEICANKKEHSRINDDKTKIECNKIKYKKNNEKTFITNLKQSNNKISQNKFSCYSNILDNPVLDNPVLDNPVLDNQEKYNSYFLQNNSENNNFLTFGIFIAELTNSKELTFNEKKNYLDYQTENKIFNTYNFNSIVIDFKEFKEIFFNSNTNYLNISDLISDKIKLNNQIYESNNLFMSFILTNAIKKIYIEKNNYNNMDANTLIEIEKEVNKYSSLYDFNYIINSLSLDEILHIIKINNIASSEYQVKFKIKVYYKSEITNIPCIMYFNYIITNLSEFNSIFKNI